MRALSIAGEFLVTRRYSGPDFSATEKSESSSPDQFGPSDDSRMAEHVIREWSRALSPLPHLIRLNHAFYIYVFVSQIRHPLPKSLFRSGL
jgi:hypothetical protein